MKVLVYSLIIYLGNGGYFESGTFTTLEACELAKVEAVKHWNKAHIHCLPYFGKSKS